jgi:hypothetical protein
MFVEALLHGFAKYLYCFHKFIIPNYFPESHYKIERLLRRETGLVESLLVLALHYKIVVVLCLIGLAINDYPYHFFEKKLFNIITCRICPDEYNLIENDVHYMNISGKFPTESFS